jgi:hypothetical protein
MDERHKLISLLKALVKTSISLAEDHPLKAFYNTQQLEICREVTKLDKKRQLAKDLMDRWHDDAVLLMEGREELEWVYKMNAHPYHEGVKLLYDYDERACVDNLKKMWDINRK